jgi:hypothetical protein
MFSTGQNTWDSDINTLGGIKNVTLYESCYSNNASANAQQGKISSGVNSIIFEPPRLDLTLDVPRESGYLGNRVMVDYNKIQKIYADGADSLATVNEKPELEGKSTAAAVAEKVAQASVAPATTGEAFASVPGLVDSHFIHESYKERATNSKLKEWMKKIQAAQKKNKEGKATFDNPESCGCKKRKKGSRRGASDKSLRVVILVIIIFFVFAVCFLCNSSLQRFKYLIMNYFNKDATVNTSWTGARNSPTARIPDGYGLSGFESQPYTTTQSSVPPMVGGRKETLF